MRASFCLPFLGLIAGSVVWFLTRPSDPAPIINHPSSIINTWSWRDSPTPPLLPREAVAPAIAVCLALRGPDGGPASPASRLASLRALLIRLPAAGFPRLLEALSASATPEDHRLRDVAFDSWIVCDPASATRWGFAQGPGVRRLLLSALQAWAGLDPLAAATWGCALSDEGDARWLGGAALTVLAAQDPARALALAGSRDAAFRLAVLDPILGALGKADPAGTLRTFAPELWKNGQGFSVLQDVLANWAGQDPDAAIAWLVAQPRGEPRQLTAWLSNLAIVRPESSAAIAAAIVRAPGDVSHTEALAAILRDWNAREPGRVLPWLDALPDRDLRLTLLARISDSAYGNDPEKTLPLALALPEGARRSQNLASLLRDWAGTDAPAALAWLSAHASEPGIAVASRAVQTVILGDIARREPATAVAEWERLSDPVAKTEAIHAIAHAWGETDPGAALRWSTAQLRARDTLSVNPQLMHAWRQQDPEAALRWAEAETLAQRAGTRQKLYPTPLSALAGEQDSPAPRAETADLYLKIQDPALRVETLTTHLREWLGKDRPAAQAWLESHDVLSPAQAAALLAP